MNKLFSNIFLNIIVKNYCQLQISWKYVHIVWVSQNDFEVFRATNIVSPVWSRPLYATHANLWRSNLKWPKMHQFSTALLPLAAYCFWCMKLKPCLSDGNENPKTLDDCNCLYFASKRIYERKKTDWNLVIYLLIRSSTYVVLIACIDDCIMLRKKEYKPFHQS